MTQQPGVIWDWMLASELTVQAQKEVCFEERESLLLLGQNGKQAELHNLSHKETKHQSPPSPIWQLLNKVGCRFKIQWEPIWLIFFHPSALPANPDGATKFWCLRP